MTADEPQSRTGGLFAGLSEVTRLYHEKFVRPVLTLLALDEIEIEVAYEKDGTPAAVSMTWDQFVRVASPWIVDAEKRAKERTDARTAAAAKGATPAAVWGLHVHRDAGLPFGTLQVRAHRDAVTEWEVAPDGAVRRVTGRDL